MTQSTKQKLESIKEALDKIESLTFMPAPPECFRLDVCIAAKEALTTLSELLTLVPEDKEEKVEKGWINHRGEGVPSNLSACYEVMYRNGDIETAHGGFEWTHNHPDVDVDFEIVKYRNLPTLPKQEQS